MVVSVHAAPDTDSKAAARRTLIEELAATVGRSWAERRRSELRSEGRRAAGGWPGTMREARGCIEHALTQELHGRNLAAFTADERETAARAANASARTAWLRAADPDDG